MLWLVYPIIGEIIRDFHCALALPLAAYKRKLVCCAGNTTNCVFHLALFT